MSATSRTSSQQIPEQFNPDNQGGPSTNSTQQNLRDQAQFVAQALIGASGPQTATLPEFPANQELPAGFSDTTRGNVDANYGHLPNVLARHFLQALGMHPNYKVKPQVLSIRPRLAYWQEAKEGKAGPAYGLKNNTIFIGKRSENNEDVKRLQDTLLKTNTNEQPTSNILEAPHKGHVFTGILIAENGSWERGTFLQVPGQDTALLLSGIRCIRGHLIQTGVFRADLTADRSHLATGTVTLWPKEFTAPRNPDLHQLLQLPSQESNFFRGSFSCDEELTDEHGNPIAMLDSEGETYAFSNKEGKTVHNKSEGTGYLQMPSMEKLLPPIPVSELIQKMQGQTGSAKVEAAPPPSPGTPQNPAAKDFARERELGSHSDLCSLYPDLPFLQYPNLSLGDL
ncbi:MAG: hypothetical protein HC848_04100 [Limnobacter sp.]|nr:hypothetical protein [Limnobacter sp.]